MSNLLDQAGRWRERAEELRAVADKLTNQIARDSLLDMADAYERLASQVAKIRTKVPRRGT